MPVVIPRSANPTERSSVTFALTLTIPGTGVSVSMLRWSLYDAAGAIVNGREDVALTPATTASVTLSGADLAVSGTASTLRRMLVEATYSSSNGSGLAFVEEIWFSIVPLETVP